jgi:ATP-dependent RNA helicase RhlE
LSSFSVRDLYQKCLLAFKGKLMNFENLGLSESLLKAVNDYGYTVPTPIQLQAIPAVLRGSDIMASAQTGTGKTAGFTLPLLQKLSQGPRASANQTRALILTPTRELAAQVHDSIETYGKYENLRSTVVFGGVKINPQMMKLRGGVEILVATPGRLLDLYQQKAIRFDQVEVLILDEADRMLDMGFINDIKKILSYLPRQRQNLMFSATFSAEIQQLARGLLHNPVSINVAPVNTAAELVEQQLHPVDKSRKAELLSHLIRSEGWYQALVFSRTKHGANKLVKQLQMDGINAGAIHGNKSQAQRTKVLDQFKKGDLQILVATDIAARGIDIDQLPQVVNFDLPDVPEDYVHRIGRTGRAGSEGKAVSLVSADEIKQLKDVERVLKRQIPRVDVPGFEPRESLNNARPTPRPAQQRRPEQRSARPAANGNSGNRSESGSRNSGNSSSGAGRNAGAGRNEGAGRSAGTGRSDGAGRSAGTGRNESAGNQPNRRTDSRRPSGSQPARKAPARTEVLSVW